MLKERKVKPGYFDPSGYNSTNGSYLTKAEEMRCEESMKSLETVVKDLEKHFRVTAEQNTALRGSITYTIEYAGMLMRFGGRVRSTIKSVLFIATTTNTIVYAGQLQGSSDYYIQLFKLWKSNRMNTVRSIT